MNSFLCHTINLAIGLLLAANLIFPGNAAGQEEGNLFHWAYAPAFGTGVYRIADEQTYVLTFKPKIDLRKGVDHQITAKVTLPLSFGLQTLDLDELISEDLPDYMTTGSFVPGLELLVPVGRSWMVKPYANFGWGTNFKSDESAWIYFGGLKSRYIFNWSKTEFGLLNELKWAGYNPNEGKQDTFARFMIGLEAKHPLGSMTYRNQQLFIQPHILYYRYLDNLEFFTPLSGEGGLSLDEEVELALAVGTATPQKIWFLRPDRIGVGLRLSEDLQGIRFFIRSVFE